MKPRKHIPIALALCAVPAVAVGQVTTTCTGCTHALSHYMGSGGLIATATEGTKKVTWLGQCGGVVRTGELTPDDDGMVSALFSEENGLACVAEKASFELGPIMDGGWFWITDEKNSAVGLLVDKEVHKALKDDAVKIASAGDGVKMTAGIGAVYLKETATGRVGILPNILPKQPSAAVRPCGYTTGGTVASPTYSVLNTSCQLGDGSAFGYASTTNAVTGTTIRIPDGGAVTRPGGDGTLVFWIYAWMKPGGHFTNPVPPGTDIQDDRIADARLGHSQFASVSPAPEAPLYSLTTLSTRAFLGATGPYATDLVESSAGDGNDPNARFKWGVRVTGFGRGAKIEIRKDESFCSKTNNVSLPLLVELVAAEKNLQDENIRDQVTPRIKAIATYKTTRGSPRWIVTRNQFTIVCPSRSASSHEGRELVPDNPFPVE